ncbi:hypothetical protein TSUD_85660 [Trifolium subterraneum]|uniref:Uncharacterized protein n=1 Tax=Trifolium subterraneum TaxID=3900 RepID=A0A2Z6P755_TRISU|nr:hypothetical protein TSUD_85660 [Trifolium subterraneum]
MLKTLERYQKCNYGAPETNVSAREALELSSQQEYLKLKARYEALQRSERFVAAILLATYSGLLYGLYVPDWQFNVSASTSSLPPIIGKIESAKNVSME